MSSIEEVNHMHIPIQELSEATNGFSDANLLARGGFGKVYKGVSVKHGSIAIKMLDPWQGPGKGQGDHEFKTEIALLSIYKHENITVAAEHSFLISNPCGTYGYIDPEYSSTGCLTQKSDVFSFGVVLFEVLCGRPTRVRAFRDERQFLTNLIKIHWRRKTLDEIIYPDLQKQINGASLVTFSSIAYQCLMSGNERPTMKKVVEQLQKALDEQLVSCCGSIKGFTFFFLFHQFFVIYLRRNLQIQIL
ncbi:putative protein kinase RLK-Pelle-CrRLK1L-1 family [Helianthus annuus]|nr:putative protein kinase RLK-Pelle-CrRLK1L-1 family [Helianthus annuus]KAJ0721159.1 putative protein kinase RLK-Pelle-CrRLK1L-1 family [Helianthus annuus]